MGFLKGVPSWNKGRKLTEAHSEALSVAQKKRFERDPVWNKGGGNYTPEMRERMSESHLGQTPWNKGRSLTEEHRRKLSESHKGQISACGMRGKKHSPETLRKMRVARLKAISSAQGVRLRPAYNTTACKFFAWFDHEYNTVGQYATNGGEYLIKELGYFVDYFNPGMKLIIEWDEEHHYRNGELQEKDIQRQEEIMRHFPEYELLRIRESRFDVAKLSEVAA